MLDKWFEIQHREQVKTAERDAFVDLLAKLPIEELVKIRETGEIKLAFGYDCDGVRDLTWLDHFKGTPLYPQAIALEEEELRMQAADDQQDIVRSQERSQHTQARDSIRLQKKLLELELSKLEVGQASAGAPPPPPTPGMGAPPGMGAQGAGAPGDMAPEGAGAPDAAPGKFGSAIRFKFASVKMKTASGMISPIMAGAGGIGAMKGALSSDELGVSPMLGAVGGGLGALGGAGLGEMAGGVLGGALGGERGRILGALAGGAGGGMLGYHVGTAPPKHHEKSHKEKKSSVRDFISAAAPVAMDFAKKHPGAVIGGGLGLAHGLMKHDGGIGSALGEGAMGAAAGHGIQSLHEGGHLESFADKARKMYQAHIGEAPPDVQTATVAKEAATRPPFLGGSEKNAFGALLGGLAAGAGKMLAGSGGLGGLATKAMNFVKANPMKAVGAGLNAGTNMMQAHQQGQGAGGTLLSGLAGGASALG